MVAGAGTFAIGRAAMRSLPSSRREVLLGAGRNARAAAQDRERMDRRVGLELDAGIDPGRLRIHDGDARQHVFSVHARA